MTQPQFKLKPAAAAAAFVVPREMPAVAVRLTENLADLVRPISRGDKTELALQVVAALDALRRGAADWNDCNALAEASNYALLFCEKGIGADYINDVHAAQDALIRIKQRANRTRRYVADGPGLQALAVLVDLYEAQLEHEDCTPALWAWAMAECEKRIAFGNVVRAA